MFNVYFIPKAENSEKKKEKEKELTIWNKDLFGDVNFKVDQAQSAMDNIQDKIVELGISESMQQQEKIAQADLQLALSFQESFWKEKAKLQRFTQGDRNTSYFHKGAKIKYASKHMSVLRNGDAILDSGLEIEQHVLNYFTALYAFENDCEPPSLNEQVIPNSVSSEENAMLTNLPSLEEARNVVFAMNASRDPGPDGFGGVFYQKFWDIIGVDVHNSVMQFFSQSWLLPNLNSNLVVLIPKFKDVDRIEDFRQKSWLIDWLLLLQK